MKSLRQFTRIQKEILKGLHNKTIRKCSKVETACLKRYSRIKDLRLDFYEATTQFLGSDIQAY